MNLSKSPHRGRVNPRAAVWAERTARNARGTPERQRGAIAGTVCGLSVEAIEDPRTQQIRCLEQIRYLDKLADKLAKGRPLETVLSG